LISSSDSYKNKNSFYDETGNRSFLNWFNWGGVQLCPLSNAVTNRPIVLAPGDYEDGEIGGMMIDTALEIGLKAAISKFQRRCDKLCSKTHPHPSH
jgi:hypothetical protein